MSANADLITVGTYTTKDTPNIQFCIIWVRMLKCIFLAIWCACVCVGGGCVGGVCVYFAFQLSSHPYL